ncbi:hypothetical protein ACFXPT_15065 [Streptomyces goshikiensis]|uniref:beta family protein n=1 Tax=Streptomyces goshikiensis TaxID=1942 RepID=UPI0036A40BD1
MSGPLYVPVLSARRHATAAYRNLSPAVQSDVIPLWNLPPRHGTASDVLVSCGGKPVTSAKHSAIIRPGSTSRSPMRPS